MSMRLLEQPFSIFEKEETLRMLNGCVARICVSDDALEIIRMVGFANSYISMLAQNNMLRIANAEKGE
jgi:hypothetical protein